MLKPIPLLLLLLICGSVHAEQGSDQDDKSMTETAALSVLNIARSLIAQGRDADAIARLQQLTSTSPDHFQAWFLLGVTQARQRQFHDAIVSFGQVVKLQPKLAEPHNNLAVIYNELGDFRAAVRELEASLKLKPDYTTAQENIGDLYVKLAAEAYRRVLAKDDSPRLRQRYERLLHIRDIQKPALASTAAPKPVQQPSVEAQHTVSEAVASKSASADTMEKKLAAEKSGDVVLKSKAPKTANTEDDIRAALRVVEAWRSAWSRQDVQAYFTAYSPAFVFGERFETRQQWQHYKRRVITKRSFIMVTLENLKAKILPNGEIEVVFLQHFRSDSFNSDDIKALLLRQTKDGWKIIHEISK